MLNAASGTLTKRELVQFLYKHRRQLVRAFLLPFFLIIAISFIPTPRYEAQSVLIVRLGSEYVYQPEVGSPQNGTESTIPFDRDQMFKSEVAILESDDLHAAVIQNIGLDSIYPEILHPVGVSWVVHKIGNAVNNLLVAVGLEEKMTDAETARRQLAKAVLLFDKRFDVMLEKESAVIDVSFQHKDADMAKNALNTLLQLYAEKRKTLYMEPRFEMAKAQAQATRMHALASERAVEVFKLKHAVHSLADERTALLQQQSDLAKQSLTYSSPGVARQLSAVSQKLHTLDTLERELSSLEREAQIANDSYSLYAHKLDEAKAYEDLQRDRAGSIRLIQAPIVPADPKKWQWIIILAGGFLSLVSVLLAAIWTEFSQTGFTTPERLERALGLPVLCVVKNRA